MIVLFISETINTNNQNTNKQTPTNKQPKTINNNPQVQHNFGQQQL